MVWLVQHPRERFHPIGTARIARLGLRRFEQTVVHTPCEAPPTGLPRDAALLFPGPQVAPLSSIRPAGRPSTLVVVDGTWHHARTMFRDNAWLQRLPRYGLSPTAPSRYRLRKEPAAHCLSTIEAIVQALSALEPETHGLDALLASFAAMIDDQLAIIHTRRRGPRRPLAPRPKGLPASMWQQPQRVVVVAGEAVPRGRDGDGYRVMHWVAARAARTGWSAADVFEGFGRPPESRFPNDCHLKHLGLSAATLRAGSSQAELQRAWRDFVKADDIIVGWTAGALQLLGATLLPPAHSLQLKSIYCSHHKGACGPLDQLVTRLNIPPPVVAASGRAAHTVRQMLGLLMHLHMQQRPPAEDVYGVNSDLLS